jgi:putative ABC transport system permease protein
VTAVWLRARSELRSRWQAWLVLALLIGVTGGAATAAALLAIAAAVTLGHTLWTSIRRRRRDLAILKTLGFIKRQVSATVAWQSTAMVLVALAVGIPLGVAAGRWAWQAFADQLGIVPEPVVPAVAVVLLLPATFLAANVIAFWPGRRAARLQAAAVLRSE